MRIKAFIILTLLLVAFIPSSALAQEVDETDNEDDVLVRINGPLTLEAGETAGTIVVISADAVVEGSVTEMLVVIDGQVTLGGTVEGDVVVASGEINLLETAQIEGDLNLYDSDVTRAAGSVIEGSTNEQSAFTWSAWDSLALSAFLWAVLTVSTVIFALLFAAIGGRQLVTSASYISERPGHTILAAVLGGLLIPVVAVLAILTIFGIPVGLAILLLLMPLMVGLGYIVTGTRLGLWIVDRERAPETIEHPYLAAVLGVIILHVVGLVPFIGALIQFLAAVIGAGALTLLAWNAWRSRGVTAGPPPIVMTEEPSPAN